MMLWTGSIPGIAMCQIAVLIGEPRMSGFGYKQTSGRLELKSALPPGTDIPMLTLDFRF